MNTMNMAKAVNLTEHQVRNRRENLAFARYLQRTRESFKNQPLGLLPPTTTPAQSASATTSDEAAIDVSTPQLQPPSTIAEAPPPSCIAAIETEQQQKPSQPSLPAPATPMAPPTGAASLPQRFHYSQEPGPSTKRQTTPPSPLHSKRAATPRHQNVNSDQEADQNTRSSLKRPRRSLSDAKLSRRRIWSEPESENFAMTEHGMAIKEMMFCTNRG